MRDGSLVLFGDGASDAGLRPFVDLVRIQLDTSRSASLSLCRVYLPLRQPTGTASIHHRRVWRCCLGSDVVEEAVDPQ